MTKDAKQVQGVLKALILEAQIFSGQRVFGKSAHESINEKPRWTTSGVCSNPSRKMAPHIGRQSNKGTSLHDSFPMPGRWHLKRELTAKSPPFVPKWMERAERWAAGLAAGNWPSRAALARAEGFTRAYVTQVLGRLNRSPETIY
jgi:hypothetical protein